MVTERRTQAQVVTFDGYEGDRLACPRINVWRDYDDRLGKDIAVTVNHGSTGLLLARKGDACQVQVGEATGWLTYYFIRELKGAWQTAQLNRQ